MSDLIISVNAQAYQDDGKTYGLGRLEPFETYFDNLGDLYRNCVEEYGRCIGKVYIGEDTPRAVGWIFVKRMPFEDVPETYLHETWVTVHNSMPVVTTTYDYKFI